jgi:hypothetical protein
MRKSKTLSELRREYHRSLGREIVREQKDGRRRYPNFADGASKASCEIAWEIVRQLGYKLSLKRVRAQTAGGRFEGVTREFLQESFELLHHIRPGRWDYTSRNTISLYAQYAHLAELEKLVSQSQELSASLGRDYIIRPDILIGRYPLHEKELNSCGTVVAKEEEIATRTPLRQTTRGGSKLILHASISCKWTVRSDRSQNARTEALNLIRNRKGNMPHVAVVTAEPLPTRIASLALGTGDLDCVYHIALYELQSALDTIRNEDQADMLAMLVDGNRLRDISDLPLDLAV